MLIIISGTQFHMLVERSHGFLRGEDLIISVHHDKSAERHEKRIPVL